MAKIWWPKVTYLLVAVQCRFLCTQTHWGHGAGGTWWAMALATQVKGNPLPVFAHISSPKKPRDHSIWASFRQILAPALEKRGFPDMIPGFLHLDTNHTKLGVPRRHSWQESAEGQKVPLKGGPVLRLYGEPRGRTCHGTLILLLLLLERPVQRTYPCRSLPYQGAPGHFISVAASF